MPDRPKLGPLRSVLSLTAPQDMAEHEDLCSGSTERQLWDRTNDHAETERHPSCSRALHICVKTPSAQLKSYGVLGYISGSETYVTSHIRMANIAII